MKKRVFVILVVLIAVTLGLAATAEAKRIEGTGRLVAEGCGAALVHGDGWVRIKGHGIGVVTVAGADKLSAKGHGRREELPDGTIRFAGWSGTIRASGESLTVRMAGCRIEFEAVGRGWVYLKGRGTYEVNGFKGRWSAEGQVIHLQK